MVNEIKKHIDLSDKIAKAMASVDREIFVPKGMMMAAYRLDALPIRGKQFISSPLTVAKMTKYLEPEGADTILEIGCGSGYQAAVLSKIVRRVLSVERIEKLLKEARASFKAAGIINVMTKLDDGQSGWAEYAPFDRILFSASASEIPVNLISQLDEGGIMVFLWKKARSRSSPKWCGVGQDIRPRAWKRANLSRFSPASIKISRSCSIEEKRSYHADSEHTGGTLLCGSSGERFEKTAGDRGSYGSQSRDQILSA